MRTSEAFTFYWYVRVLCFYYKSRNMGASAESRSGLPVKLSDFINFSQRNLWVAERLGIEMEISYSPIPVSIVCMKFLF